MWYGRLCIELDSLNFAPSDWPVERLSDPQSWLSGRSLKKPLAIRCHQFLAGWRVTVSALLVQTSLPASFVVTCQAFSGLMSRSAIPATASPSPGLSTSTEDGSDYI